MWKQALLLYPQQWEMQDAKQSWEVVNQGPEMMLASAGGPGHKAWGP